MKYVAPTSVDLTTDETELYKKIFRPLSPEHWPETEAAMEALTASLLERDAVPEVRQRLFADATFAEIHSRSPRDTFEINGVRGDEIFRHVDFLPYLRHFIHGPDLPRPVIDGLITILNEDRGTAGMLLKQYEQFARKSVKAYRLSRSIAATEFYRLGVEIGMSVASAKTLRKAALSAR